MDLKNKQIFKKNIISPLLKSIKEEFLSDKSKEEKFYRFELEINDLADDFDPIAGFFCKMNLLKHTGQTAIKIFVRQELAMQICSAVI